MYRMVPDLPPFGAGASHNVSVSPLLPMYSGSTRAKLEQLLSQYRLNREATAARENPRARAGHQTRRLMVEAANRRACMGHRSGMYRIGMLDWTYVLRCDGPLRLTRRLPGVTPGDESTAHIWRGIGCGL